MKSKLLIVLIILSVLFSLTSVSAADNQTEVILDSADDYCSFSELNQIISESVNEINLEHDYKYDNSYDNESIMINKEGQFIINGNGHVIDGAVNLRLFTFDSNDVVIVNNLTFQNFINSSLRIRSPVIFNNVNFINCTSQKLTSFLYCDDDVQFDGCIIKDTNMAFKFIANYGGDTVFKNSVASGGYVDEGIISADRHDLIVENCTFENISSRIGSAINFKGNNLIVKKSKFINLNASATGGAIIAKFFSNNDVGDSLLIEDCEFTNVTASYNGSALYYDLDSGSNFMLKTLDIINTTFTNSKSTYGGVIVDLGGILNIVNSTIENSYAGYEGGAIYTSWASLNIINTTLSNTELKRMREQSILIKAN